VDGSTTSTPYRGHQNSRERKTKSDRHRDRTDATEYGVVEDSTLLEQPADYPSIYDGVKESWLPNHRSAKLGAQRYRREQLIEMVQRSLAENLSFQNQRYVMSYDRLLYKSTNFKMYKRILLES